VAAIESAKLVKSLSQENAEFREEQATQVAKLIEQAEATAYSYAQYVSKDKLDERIEELKEELEFKFDGVGSFPSPMSRAGGANKGSSFRGSKRMSQ